jgi:hypothetical protein
MVWTSECSYMNSDSGYTHGKAFFRNSDGEQDKTRIDESRMEVAFRLALSKIPKHTFFKVCPSHVIALSCYTIQQSLG